jgi:uncharacterized protein YozE (UPF0346 family)
MKPSKDYVFDTGSFDELWQEFHSVLRETISDA